MICLKKIIGNNGIVEYWKMSLPDIMGLPNIPPESFRGPTFQFGLAFFKL